MNSASAQTSSPSEPTETRRGIGGLFTHEEIKRLTARSDLRGLWAVSSTWAVIVAVFWLMAWGSAQPLALAIPIYALGLCLIAGRQLCLAILMHDASHGSLFKTKWLNQHFVDWTCARPIWNDLGKYRVHHNAHHRMTGTAHDPDITLVETLPCTRASLTRKVLRDLSGMTGVKFLVGRLLMDMGYVKWTVANDVVPLPREGVTFGRRLTLLAYNAGPTILVNAMLLGALWATGHPALFIVWFAAYITPFSLFVRIRSMAEHACMERTSDTFKNTRTTRAGWLARATVAPLRVHYHLEHHAMTAVPYYRLHRMHNMLRERGAIPAPPGYLAVLRTVSSMSPQR